MADSLTGITFRYAGFWLRLVALLIDGAVLLIIMWLLALVFGVNVASLEPTDAELESFRIFEQDISASVMRCLFSSERLFALLHGWCRSLN